MIIRGILFRSTIRGGHASLVIALNDGKDEKVVLVVVRFGGSDWNKTPEHDVDRCYEMMTRLRSNVRRVCKVGNELEFVGSLEKSTIAADGTKSLSKQTVSTSGNGFGDWDRFVVDYYLSSSDGDKCGNIRLVQPQKYDAKTCQILQNKYFPASKRKQEQKQKRRAPCVAKDIDSIHHKSGLGKRQQGEVLADFLLFVLSTIYDINDETNINAINRAVWNEKYEGYTFGKRMIPYELSTSSEKTISDRNGNVAKLLEQRKVGSNGREHSGHILDVAGGAGHVSLALTLRNVNSTVVDPRSTVGSLPGRDRKLLKKSKKSTFRTYRAWFGSKPEGVDTFFREGCKTHSMSSESRNVEFMFEQNEKEMVPVCTIHSEDQLLLNCTAIVGLHPDEATGMIVKIAVENRIPFVVV